MKVAILSTCSWRTPPTNYGPWELFSSILAEGLHRKGVDVTLFATQDSQTTAKLEAVVPMGTEQNKFYGDGKMSKDSAEWLGLHIAHCMSQASNFDVIHNNLNYPPLFYTPYIKTPMVTTIHNGTVEFDESALKLEIYKKYNPGNHYVAISNSAQHPELTYKDVIYHGVNVQEYAFQPTEGKYLLVFGRLDHDKGIAEAIQVAKISGKKLVIAGIISNPKYFKEEIQPHIDGVNVEYIGAVGGEKKDQVLGQAFALLHLINFNEPFGFSVIEAMACGTPVVALNKGSMKEIIQHGKTGFIVESLSDVIFSLEKVKNLNRYNCRNLIEQKFTQDIMVDRYLALYEMTLRKNTI